MPSFRLTGTKFSTPLVSPRSNDRISASIFHSRDSAIIVNNNPWFFRLGQTSRTTLTLMLAFVFVALPSIGLVSSSSFGGEEQQNQSQTQEEVEEQLACSTDRRVHTRRPKIAGQSRSGRVPQSQVMSRTKRWQRTKLGHRLANGELAPLRC